MGGTRQATQARKTKAIDQELRRGERQGVFDKVGIFMTEKTQV